MKSSNQELKNFLEVVPETDLNTASANSWVPEKVPEVEIRLW